MPPAERQRLLENLKKFDLLYTPEQQRSLREIDRRINELEPERRDSYLAALRRYHNWLGRLADNKRDELNAKPPAERLELVKRLVKDNPVPRAQTPLFLRITDLGDYSPFELAAFFKIWQVLPADQKQKIENSPGPSRRGALLSRGVAKKMPTEITPADFAEPHWIRRVETDLRQAASGGARHVRENEKKRRLASPRDLSPARRQLVFCGQSAQAGDAGPAS